MSSTDGCRRSWLQSLLWVGWLAAAVLLPCSVRAGGPGLVAGASFFDPVVKGVPLTWQGGQVTYYTDQGNLSSLLPHAAADSFVADAFSRWTGVTTAAITATRAGQLGEDVSGANFYVNSDGTLVMPADLLPSAVSKPVGIMYDANGAVTDALLGSGASTLCFSNSAFEQLDNFDDEAHRLHALVIVNGACAQTANQLIDLKYRLVRALGRVLGLDWSQVNVNIFTHNPPWTQADLSGISIMHAVDPINCVPISICFPNADVPKMDDRAAISRLYPVTPDNQGQFPGKPLFAANTARVHGSVYFSRGGEAAQGMQGVNVVARWIDPATGLPSRSTVAAAVSGARFRGNAGNPVNGYEDPGGNRYDRFGSDDETIEGAFDLAGLEIPSGSSAQYQISAEALDGTWSYGIGPYITSQVTPSGSFQPVVVTVSKGEDLAQDALMLGSAVTAADGFQPTTYSEPAPLPASGEWIATLNGYGDADYFWFNGQANRSLSVQVKSLDESSVATEEKARPMIGMWALSDPPGTLASASTPAPFSSFTFGMTQLDAMLLGTTAFRVGIADARGDGRPDYAYHARILYGDTAAPRRVSALGGSPLIVTGLGFRPELKVSVGGVPVTLLSAAGGQLLFSTPAVADGLAAVVISDADGKATSTMSGAVTFGAAADDSIRLEQGSNPGTPVGIEAPNPIKVSVRSADGSTPVPGASVVFSVSPAASFSACGGATTCTLHTDESGRASSRITVLSAAVMTITVSLAPASYNPAKYVQTTLLGVSSGLDLGLSSPYQFAAAGATLDVGVTARVLSNGTPLSGRSVGFTIQTGSGSLSSTLVTSNATGYASTTLHVANIQSEVRVIACVEPGDAPCQIFYLGVVPDSSLRLQPVSGISQAAFAGGALQPVQVRATDDAAVPNPVRGVNVRFDALLCRPQTQSPGNGDPVMPVILSSWETTVISDANGLASVQPSTGRMSGTTELLGEARAGASSVPYSVQSFEAPGGNDILSSGPAVLKRLPKVPVIPRHSPIRAPRE